MTSTETEVFVNAMKAALELPGVDETLLDMGIQGFGLDSVALDPMQDGLDIVREAMSGKPWRGK